MPGAWPDSEVIHDLNLRVTGLIPGNTSSIAILDGLQCHQFVCVARRRKPKTDKPFQAVMWFPNGERLTLLDIVRSRHHAGESALLSGPHMAGLTGGSIPDEALQLPAAVQFSGFRSVIGTMWGIDGEDGRDPMENDYWSMFLGKNGVEHYNEGSARILQHAVQQMRRHRLPLARWVNYVHYGL
jgi:hypothetical protein